jgi:hypothetical protein
MSTAEVSIIFNYGPQFRSSPDEACRLKCDRKEPCGNCTARNFECVYASSPRARDHGQRKEVHQLTARVRHLEQLVNTIVTSQNSGQPPISIAPDTATSDPSSTYPKPGGRSNGDIEANPGHILNMNNSTVYVSGVHWASICNEVRSCSESYSNNPLMHLNCV